MGGIAEGGSGSVGTSSSVMPQAFAILFPGSPAVNALLATLYISGPPNFLLALCPTDIDPASLSVMVAFAVGGLLGDTLFHLLPEIFVGEGSGQGEEPRMVAVEPNRNLLLGVAIMVGFMTFVAMDKGLRIATGGSDSHDHGHSHTSSSSAASTSVETASAGSGVAKSRKKGSGKTAKAEPIPKSSSEVSASVKLSGYLNLMQVFLWAGLRGLCNPLMLTVYFSADFTHNITDGLAMSASFYASPAIGATTTVAVFFHEIPHEVGDFALLVQSGFSKRAAMGAQFVTALGALLGTVIGIAVQEFGGSSRAGASPSPADESGLLGTSLAWGDLLLPFTAGTFLYVGTVAVIPELLQTDLGKEGSGSTKTTELRKTLVQFAAIAAGAGIMLYISWQ